MCVLVCAVSLPSVMIRLNQKVVSYETGDHFTKIELLR